MATAYSANWIAEAIAFQVVFGDLADRAHAFFARVFEVVKACFQCAAARLLGGLSESFRSGFRGFPHSPARKPELVPSHIAASQQRQNQPPLIAPLGSTRSSDGKSCR
jgi:hypothetical protein